MQILGHQAQDNGQLDTNLLIYNYLIAMLTRIAGDEKIY
jgi:hypothetical protein